MNLSTELPKWDNTTEYPSFTSSEFKNDIALVEQAITQMNSITFEIKEFLNTTDSELSDKVILQIQNILKIYKNAGLVFYNLRNYTSCELSLDAQNKDAEKAESYISKDLAAQLETALNTINIFIANTTDSNFKKILADSELEEFEFLFERERLKRKTLLSTAEENLISALKKTGHSAWGTLYQTLSSTAQVHIHHPKHPEPTSIAVAFGNTQGNDEPLRKASWEGIQNTWNTHKQTAAAILNAIAGWRHDINKFRSHTQKIDYLDMPLHDNRIEAATLAAMLSAVSDYKPILQKAAKTMAKYHDKQKLDPWDLVAPAPIKDILPLTFAESFAQVKNSFTHLDAQMGEFAQMMLDKNWIDASIRPNKRNGAYCTGFAKSRSPRVFLTFSGSPQNTSTLAHELGHAYHNWVMRDIPHRKTFYTMSLAETASIFAENTLFDYQIANAKNKNDLLDVYWSITEGAVSLLLNIPTRFEFESNFYEKRKHGYVSADELNQLMCSAFENWYGDSLSKPDPLFWATKLHFSLTGTSFYNFPYTFGYLFSLSLYARKNEWGKDFSSKYIAILRDTGIMTAEDLIQKHLGEDITKKQFWTKALDTVVDKINAFEKL